MAENKLQVIVTDESLLKEITFNYEQLKTSLTRKLKKYKELVVTEDAIKDAKEDRADLNKLEKILADKSKDIQAKILGGFDTKMKELRGMIKDTSLSIDNQVKAFEQIVKDQKRKDIEQIYSENIGELKEILPLNNFFQSTWLNTTVTIKKAEAELIAFIAKVRQDLTVIDTLNSEFTLQVKDNYLRTFDLSAALAEKARLEESKKRIEAIKPMDKVADVLISKEKTDLMPDVPWANVSEKPKEFRLVITGTESTFGLVEKFLSANKIQYKKEF